MRTIAHISDFHFGRIHRYTLEPLVRKVNQLAPDLVVLSGDFTQRARVKQFREARDYIARLPGPQVALPGNHDIPLYDVVRRFGHPLGRYRRYISKNISPVFEDDEMIVIGINSSRSFTFKGGWFDESDVERAANRFNSTPSSKARLLFTHHPFDIPPDVDDVEVVGGADHAVQTFAGCKVDAYMAGHLHLIHIASAEKFRPGYTAPLLHAASAISSRARGHPNSFFLIRIDDRQLIVQTHNWNPLLKEFMLAGEQQFPRVSGAYGTAINPPKPPTQNATDVVEVPTGGAISPSSAPTGSPSH